MTNIKTELTRYAEQNMWSFPILNMQYQLSFKRISTKLGFIDNFRYMGKTRTLPLRNKKYIVFTLSGVNTGYWNFKSIINQIDPVEKWINIADLCRERGTNVHIYDSKNKLYLRDKAWVLAARDGTNLIAIEEVQNFLLKDIKDLYLQCYTVNYEVYSTGKDELLDYRFYITSVIPKVRDDIVNLGYYYNKCQKLPSGHTFILKNGLLVNKLPKYEELTGNDYYEIYHDPSIKEGLLYKVSDCPNFYSDLDKQRKYILHPNKVEGDFKYEYFSDTDIYLVDKDMNGVFLDRNNISNIRQLTHKDISISEQSVKTAISNNSFLQSANELYFLVFRRNNEWTHYLDYEANYIRYLYRMNDENILGAMTNVNSDVKEWTASALEASTTMELNRCLYDDMTHEKVVKALGYNYLTIRQSETPLTRDVDSLGEIALPITYREKCVVFEYDKDGLYLGNYQHLNADGYKPKNDKAVLFDLVPGKSSNKFNFVIQDEDIELDPKWGWLAYVSDRKMPDNVSAGNWEVAVEGTDYEVVDGKLKWLVNIYQKIGLVAFNDQFVLREFTLKNLDNSLDFSITHEWNGGGVGLPLAPADVNIIMNGRTLIENVDYIIDYPDVHLINKEYVVEGGQKFVVYYHGWSPKITKPINRSELGFVIGGVIGSNKRYNLRENRVTKAVVDGRLFNAKNMPNAEMYEGGEILSGFNGRPYQIKHTYCAIKDVKDYDTYPGYLDAVDLDTRVSAYLTTYCDKKHKPVLPTQVNKYKLFSPFLNKIINDLVLGLLSEKLDIVEKKWTIKTLTDKTKDYKWLLDYDPCLLPLDKRYFRVLPTSSFSKMTVTADQFVFIKELNEYFLDGVCEIEDHLNVR